MEADALIGLLSDSDFTGGRIDGKGHVLKGVYGVSTHWNVAFIWFIDNETGGDRNPKGRSLDYDRIMIDRGFQV